MWDERVTELERRIKAVERENDDLHAAYRRLRASQARREILDRAEGPPVDTVPPSTGGSTKDQLRRQHLSGRAREPLQQAE